MARQATRLWAQGPPPGALISLAGAVGAAAAVAPDLSADSCGRSFEALCDPPYRPTGGNASRNLFALLKPQRYQSPPAWRWSNPSSASQDPIDAALVSPLKRSRDVRHTLTALPALPQLSLLFRREPCPCMPLHSHTSSSAKIRRCCVDSLNSLHKADIPRCLLFVRFSNRPSGSSAFRLSTTAVSMSLTGSRFSSDSAPRPFHHGDSKARWNNLLGGLAISMTAGPSGQTISPHPTSREGHHSTVRWISGFSPIWFDPA